MSGGLGIIAGGGVLPLLIADAARADGRPCFILGLEGFADPAALAGRPHGWTTFGQVGRTLKLLRENGCTDVTLAGHARRPDFRALKLDWKGARYFPGFIRAIGQGDDGLLRAVAAIFESEGFRLVGPDEVLSALKAKAGVLGAVQPSERDRIDAERGFAVVDALGRLDIGQAVVVADRVVLAVEAIEGTDAMLDRVAALPETLRGAAAARRGVLVKACKPGQDRRIDLPSIGVETVVRAAAAGLAGIVVEAGRSLILGEGAVREAADRAGLFVAAMDTPRSDG